MHVKSGHSATGPEIWAFSDRLFVPISRSKSMVLYYPSASPFSDTYLFIHRDTEFSRLQLSISNLLFFRILFNPSVAYDRFWHVFCMVGKLSHQIFYIQCWSRTGDKLYGVARQFPINRCSQYSPMSIIGGYRHIRRGVTPLTCTVWELEVQLEWQKPAWHFLPMKQQATLGQQKSKLWKQ